MTKTKHRLDAGETGKKSALTKVVNASESTRVKTGGKSPKSHVADKVAKIPQTGEARMKKPHRYRAGTVVIRDIVKQQQSVEFLLKRTPFTRLVREVIEEVTDKPMRIQAGAITALMTGAESLIVGLFTNSVKLLGNKEKVTLKKPDMQTALIMDKTLARPLAKKIDEIHMQRLDDLKAIIAAKSYHEVLHLLHPNQPRTAAASSTTTMSSN